MTFNQWASSHPFESSLRSSLDAIWSELERSNIPKVTIISKFDDLARDICDEIKQAEEAGYDSSY